MGNQQFGLSQMEMFEATVGNSGVKLVVGGGIDTKVLIASYN